MAQKYEAEQSWRSGFWFSGPTSSEGILFHTWLLYSDLLSTALRQFWEYSEDLCHPHTLDVPSIPTGATFRSQFLDLGSTFPGQDTSRFRRKDVSTVGTEPRRLPSGSDIQLLHGQTCHSHRVSGGRSRPEHVISVIDRKCNVAPGVLLPSISPLHLASKLPLPWSPFWRSEVIH